MRVVGYVLAPLRGLHRHRRHDHGPFARTMRTLHAELATTFEACEEEGKIIDRDPAIWCSQQGVAVVVEVRGDVPCLKRCEEKEEVLDRDRPVTSAAIRERTVVVKVGGTQHAEQHLHATDLTTAPAHEDLIDSGITGTHGIDR